MKFLVCKEETICMLSHLCFLLVGWKHIKYNKIMILLGLNYSKPFHPVLCSSFRKISGWEHQEALRHNPFNVPSLSTVSSAI